MRWLGAIAGLLVLVGAGLFWAGLRISPLVTHQFDTAPALAAAEAYDVEIVRDSYGVPHMLGRRDADAAFGLAYAHAEDDFSTIQEALYSTRGRDMVARSSSEGIAAYLVQLFGVRALVDARWESDLSAQTRALLQGYADGLNFYAARHPDEVLPGLFPVDAKDLARRTSFAQPLFYGMSRVLTNLISPERQREVGEGQSLQVGWIEDTIRHPVGSNGLAVAGSRSADGVTRLFVNSHQPVVGPVAWYEMRMRSEDGLDFAGGTFPGSPVPFVGHNADLGWTATVNSPDLIDIYNLTINPDNDNQYRLDGEWLDFERGEATITIQLWGPFAWQVTQETLRSRHGPVLRTERGVYALRYATMDTIAFIQTQYDMLKARSFEEFKTILETGSYPSTNRIYADKDGIVANFYLARMPNRLPGEDYEAILPGDRSELIWTDYAPFDALPHVLDPPEGFITEANSSPFVVTGGPSDPTPADFPAEFGLETNMTNRALRAVTLFKADTAITREAFIAYKFDHRYHPASDAAQMKAAIAAMDFGEDALMREAQALVASWDLRANYDNRATALSIMAMQPIGVAVFQGQQPPDLQDTLRDAAETLMRHYGRLDVPWSTVNRHVRGDFSVAIQGGPDTLRAVNSTPDPDGTLRMVSGDGLVMLIEWDADGTVSSHSVHQYGAAMTRPASRHYADQTALFASEEMKPVPFTMDALAAATAARYRPGQEP